MVYPELHTCTHHAAYRSFGGVIGLAILRVRRAPIAALVGRDASKAVRKMRKLVPPGAVRFGKAVKEDQRGSVLRPHVDDIEFDPCRKSHPPLPEIASHRPLLRSRFETSMADKMRTDKPVRSIRGSPASSAIRATGLFPRYPPEQKG